MLVRVHIFPWNVAFCLRSVITMCAPVLTSASCSKWDFITFFIYLCRPHIITTSRAEVCTEPGNSSRSKVRGVGREAWLMDRGAVLASLALCQLPACSSSGRDVQAGLFPVVALLEDSLLPDSNSVCQLPLQRRVSFHTGLVEPL